MKIFNLAEELEKERKKNKELKAKINLLEDNRIYLNNKIDKAIDTLEKRINKIKNQEWKSYTGQTDEEYLQEQKELLDILKGE
jgi:chromosome segregation ATPase